MERIHSFSPIINENSKVLILGTVPGSKSLEAKQYYQHEDNLYWDVIVRIVDKSWPIFKMADSLDYAKRVNLLLENHIALWDVIESCEREGNNDSKIVNPQYNDLAGLLKRYPNICKICFNGWKAESYFKKYLKEAQVTLANTIETEVFLSTSPSNQANSFFILGQWHIGIFQVLNIPK